MTRVMLAIALIRVTDDTTSAANQIVVSKTSAERAGPTASPNSVNREGCRELARRLLGAQGVRNGLCVHIDCGEGVLTAELGLAGRHLVQGLTTRRENVDKAREYAQSRRIYGIVSIDHSPLVELPYTDNLVNVLIVDDSLAVSESGLTISEMMRVVAPLGTLWLKETGSSVEEDLANAGFAHFPVVREGGWARIAKPWPRGMDQWPQYRHDASRAATSTDRFVRPCTSLRLAAMTVGYMPYLLPTGDSLGDFVRLRWNVVLYHVDT